MPLESGLSFVTTGKATPEAPHSTIALAVLKFLKLLALSFCDCGVGKTGATIADWLKRCGCQGGRSREQVCKIFVGFGDFGLGHFGFDLALHCLHRGEVGASSWGE